MTPSLHSSYLQCSRCSLKVMTLTAFFVAFFVVLSYYLKHAPIGLNHYSHGCKIKPLQGNALSLLILEYPQEKTTPNSFLQVGQNFCAPSPPKYIKPASVGIHSLTFVQATFKLNLIDDRSTHLVKLRHFGHACFFLK